MKPLSQNARNILIAARHDEASRAAFDSKKRENYAGALKAMLDETGPDWVKHAPSGAQPSPEDIAELDGWLSHMRHTHPRLESVESRTRAAVQQCGVPLPDGRGNLPLSPDWLAISLAISRRQRRTLLPFASAANNRRIEPPHVTDDVMTEFASRHRANRDPKSATQTIRSITNTWNEIAPSLGLHVLVQPIPYADLGHYMPDESAFAPSLLMELDRCVLSWTTVKRRGKTLSKKSAAAARNNVLLSIAAFCKASGCHVASIASLADFISVAKLTVAFEFMIGRAQVANPAAVRTDGAYNCCRSIRDAAHVLLPAAHQLHKSLNKLVTRLAPGAMPEPENESQRHARTRRRARSSKQRLPSARKQRALLPVVDQTYADLLRSTPACLYAGLESGEDPDSEYVTRLIHACALELMMSTSLWPYHVARLTFSQHLDIIPAGESVRYVIRVSAEETYHGVAREFEIVGESWSVLHPYVTRIRPMRFDRTSDFLFPGKKDEGYHTNALSQAVCRLVKDCTGHRMSSKDLRAAVAVMYGLGPDASAAVIQRFLARRQTENDPIINLIAAWRRVKPD